MSESNIGSNERAVEALVKEVAKIPFSQRAEREKKETAMQLKLQARTLDRLEHIAAVLDSLIIEGDKVRTVQFM